MSKKERLQNKYNTLNIYLGIALTAFLAVVGFIVTSAMKSAPLWLLVISGITFVILVAGVVFIQMFLNAVNDEIERL